MQAFGQVDGDSGTGGSKKYRVPFANQKPVNSAGVSQTRVQALQH